MGVIPVGWQPRLPVNSSLCPLLIWILLSCFTRLISYCMQKCVSLSLHPFPSLSLFQAKYYSVTQISCILYLSITYSLSPFYPLSFNYTTIFSLSLCISLCLSLYFTFSFKPLSFSLSLSLSLSLLFSMSKWIKIDEVYFLCSCHNHLSFFFFSLYIKIYIILLISPSLLSISYTQA